MAAIFFFKIISLKLRIYRGIAAILLSWIGDREKETRDKRGERREESGEKKSITDN